MLQLEIKDKVLLKIFCEQNISYVMYFDHRSSHFFVVAIAK